MGLAEISVGLRARRLLDQVVGASQECGRYLQAQITRGPEIDDKLEGAGALDGQALWPLTPQQSVRVLR